jgi:hypothetical protein
MEAKDWGKTLAPFDETGKAAPIEERAMTKALRRGKPAHGQFRIRSAKGEHFEIEASALPIVAEGGQEGAMIFFWTQKESRAGN